MSFDVPEHVRPLLPGTGAVPAAIEVPAPPCALRDDAPLNTGGGGSGDVTRTHRLWSFENGPDVPTPVGQPASTPPKASTRTFGNSTVVAAETVSFKVGAPPGSPGP